MAQENTAAAGKPASKHNISRIGKAPITIPAGVKVKVDGQSVEVEGAKGKLSLVVPNGIAINVDNNTIHLTCENREFKARSQHGLMRCLIADMVKGVTHGFVKNLEIVGVGYKVAMKGKDLDLAMGFSHPCIFKAPQGIEFSVDGAQKITIKGINKQLVGQVAADIRKIRSPEPYKGKGIRYAGEHIALKAGKSGKK